MTTRAATEPDPIETYVDASLAQLHRALRDAVPALVEPTDAVWDRAWPRLALLVETMVGVASGAVIGRVLSALVRAHGSALPATFATTTRETLARVRRAARATTEPARYLRDADQRPLVDELAARVHVQLIDACRTAGAALAPILAGVRATDVDRVLALCADDTLLVQLFAEHLAAGWTAYRAAVAGTAATLPPGPLGDTWRAWLRRVHGEVPQVAPRRDCIVAIG